MIDTLRVLPLGGVQEDLDAIAPRLSEALAAALRGVSVDDELNGLVLGAGLDWREVDLVRAYLEYFNQIQGALTRPFVRSVLLENPLAVRLLVRYHEARLAPGLARERARGRRGAAARRPSRPTATASASLNEDRALGALYELIDATLRTSFFRRARTERRRRLARRPSSSTRAASSGLRPPQPYREIFVHAAELDGIHLRGGPVARGGLRWSDRLDDFRTEVLGLMRTQMLKNGLIVPVGAKGGFVLRRARPLAARGARRGRRAVPRASSRACSTSPTTSTPRAACVPPAGVFRRDGDDPYLVVAADKGTAHLSDAANAIAEARGFWLGDAFASGGSEGYDHKKLAITARGAWECVKHHFAELGVDPERDAVHGRRHRRHVGRRVRQRPAADAPGEAARGLRPPPRVPRSRPGSRARLRRAPAPVRAARLELGGLRRDAGSPPAAASGRAARSASPSRRRSASASALDRGVRDRVRRWCARSSRCPSTCSGTAASAPT